MYADCFEYVAEGIVIDATLQRNCYWLSWRETAMVRESCHVRRLKSVNDSAEVILIVHMAFHSSSIYHTYSTAWTNTVKLFRRPSSLRHWGMEMAWVQRHENFNSIKNFPHDLYTLGIFQFINSIYIVCVSEQKENWKNICLSFHTVHCCSSHFLFFFLSKHVK